MNRTYSQLILLPTFADRFEYLRLRGVVGAQTFGYDRYLNQLLYRDRRWKRIRDEVIIRDDGCDLGMEGYGLLSGVIVHHINPITQRDIENESSKVFDLENLICTSLDTHNAIHYGDRALLPREPIDRVAGDTCPWYQ